MLFGDVAVARSSTSRPGPPWPARVEPVHGIGFDTTTSALWSIQCFGMAFWDDVCLSETDIFPAANVSNMMLALVAPRPFEAL